mgnify:FL=1
MNGKHNLILIGGPAACGKSTLINMMLNQGGVFYYRRNNAFFDCAQEKGIPRDAAYQAITSEQADHRFVAECLKFNTIISDVHYGVQLHRDRNFSLGQVVGLTDESYVPTISSHLLEICRKKNISVTAILLRADVAILWERAVCREKLEGKPLRATSLYDIQAELQAECFYWEQIKKNPHIKSLCFDTSHIEPDQILKQLSNFYKGDI